MANAKGIDISHWQKTTPNLDGRSFIFVRATWQTTKDKRFDMHSSNVLKATPTKTLGAYHFGTGDASPRAQAKAFLAAAGDKPSILALDLERNRVGSNMSKAQAKRFIVLVKQLDPLKRKVGLYASEGNWPGDLGQDFNWIAHYGIMPATPKRPWRFYQYRGSPLDLDQFNGTVKEMRSYSKMPSAPDEAGDPVPDPEPPPVTYTQDQLDAAVADALAGVQEDMDALQAKIAAAIVNLNEALADLA